MIVIETERLYLRKFETGDIDAMHHLFIDPVVMKYYLRLRSREETEEWVSRAIRFHDTNGHGLWAVQLKDSSELLGYCGILHQIVDERLEFEVGYMLRPDSWGHGYASEAAQASRDYAFQHLTCRRIISIIDPENAPSIAVAQRNGMELLFETEMFNRQLSIYGISREIWNKEFKESRQLMSASAV